MKVIIAGGRDFDKGQVAIDAILEFQDTYGKITEIVCGMAKGADMMGLNYGRIWEIPVKEFPANWDLHGKAAGPIRNSEMANYADGLIAFWDGKSRGTKNMIDNAKLKCLKIMVIKY